MNVLHQKTLPARYIEVVAHHGGMGRQFRLALRRGPLHETVTWPTIDRDDVRFPKIGGPGVSPEQLAGTGRSGKSPPCTHPRPKHEVRIELEARGMHAPRSGSCHHAAVARAEVHQAQAGQGRSPSLGPGRQHAIKKNIDSSALHRDVRSPKVVPKLREHEGQPQAVHQQEEGTRAHQRFSGAALRSGDLEAQDADPLLRGALTFSARLGRSHFC
mmetsp:Transcript_38288/g.83416  ORF Transcript_38288/g.83416 Transcript_38288/m.83416 type:complete len:215 (+) Transcript_38288:169-813(+)